MTTPALILVKDADALAARACDLIIRLAGEAIQERGRFTLVLAGGSTPEKTYTVLAQPDRAAALNWSKSYVFMGDERLVPPEDSRSNFGMARRALLAHVPVPTAQVFPVPIQETAAESAAEYASQLARFFPGAVQSPPHFDLILLGLGDDGHTASLFPGAAALQVDDAWVTWSPPGTLPPPVDRVTLTYPVLNAARHVVFLVGGANKATALRDILEGQPTRAERPAAGIQPVDGPVTWIVDEAAGRLLTHRS